MSNRYRHPTFGVVTIVRMLGSYCFVQTEKDGIQESRLSQMQPIADPIEFPATPPTQTNEPSDDQDDETKVVTIAINKVSANQLAKALPHIGKLKAKQIIDNMPQGGYVDFDDLQKANPTLFSEDGELTTQEWIDIEPLITYET